MPRINKHKTLILTVAAVVGCIVIIVWWPGTVPDETAGPSAAVEVQPIMRFVVTHLVDLQLQSYSISEGLPEFYRAAGTVEQVSDGFILADQTGRFAQFDSSESGTGLVRWLQPRLRLNRREMQDFFAEQQSRYNIHPVRVTDLLFLPDTKRVLASYGLWDVENTCIRVGVSVIGLDELLNEGMPTANEWQPVFVTDSCIEAGSGHETGGRMVRLSDTSILLGIGSTSIKDPGHGKRHPQFGTTVEVDLENGQHTTFSTGHRNMQGLALDSQGRVWATEHGPEGGDELNLIVRGRDYGWPNVTYGLPYGKREWRVPELSGRHDGFEEPVFAWLPSIGVNNVVEVRDFSPRWDGDLLAISLRQSSLHRLRMSQNRVVYEERIKLGDRLRDVLSIGGGTIVVWNDDAELIFATQVAHDDGGLEQKIALLPDNVAALIIECRTCHTLEQGAHSKDKIPLFGVYRRKIASGAPKELYTPALIEYADNRHEWKTYALDRYLRDPDGMVPGTAMSAVKIEDKNARRDVVEFLKTLR